MQPEVQHKHHDPHSGVTYLVFAYRELEEHEILTAIQVALGLRKKKDWPKRGETFYIYTVLGAERG